MRASPRPPWGHKGGGFLHRIRAPCSCGSSCGAPHVRAAVPRLAFDTHRASGGRARRWAVASCAHGVASGDAHGKRVPCPPDSGAAPIGDSPALGLPEPYGRGFRGPRAGPPGACPDRTAGGKCEDHASMQPVAAQRVAGTARQTCSAECERKRPQVNPQGFTPAGCLVVGSRIMPARPARPCSTAAEAAHKRFNRPRVAPARGMYARARSRGERQNRAHAPARAREGPRSTSSIINRSRVSTGSAKRGVRASTLLAAPFSLTLLVSLLGGNRTGGSRVIRGAVGVRGRRWRLGNGF